MIYTAAGLLVVLLSIYVIFEEENETIEDKTNKKLIKVKRNGEWVDEEK